MWEYLDKDNFWLMKRVTRIEEMYNSHKIWWDDTLLSIF
jgi:hypothetical protein